MSESRPTLVREGLALSSFLQSLLREPALEIAPPPAPVPTPLPVDTPPIPTLLDVPPAPLAGEPPVAESVHAAAAPPRAEDRPAWAEEPFQCMLFKAGGLNLAVALVELHGILEWSEHITPMPGHAPFYLGLVKHRGRSVPVVDTARLVLPADRRQELVHSAPGERLTRIILIGDAAWGLACDSVGEVLSLRPDQVRWRTQRTRRRWLAGTVVEHMCALLDARAFAHLLETGAE